MKHPLPTVVVAVLAAIYSLSPSLAATADTDQSVQDATYRVSGVTVRFVHDFALLTGPDAQQRLRDVEVELGVMDGVFVAPQAAADTVTVRIGSIGSEHATAMTTGAIDSVAAAIRAGLQRQYNATFFVAVDPRDIEQRTGRDRRPANQQTLGFKIEYTGPTYSINDFTFQYAFDQLENYPRIDDPSAVRVALVHTEDAGYVAWRPDRDVEYLTLAEINEGGAKRFSAAGVQQVLIAVRDHLTDRDYMAVRVSPSQRELDQTMNQAGTVPLLVVSGLVTEMRTLAAGDRIPTENRINNPLHERILRRSPIQPADPDRQLLRKDELDDYIFRVGRHPGRRVDVGIAPAEEDLTVSLDYIVTENRPLLLYGQVSNTGTRQVGRIRQRFGIFHNQLTGNDDIVNIDYNTANFSDSHTVVGSYEAPLFDFERIRWRVFGLYSEFDASEVGFANLRFTGDSWHAGGELIANVFQHRQLFLDVVGGARYMDVSVSNFFEGFEVVSGDEEFFLPYVGLRLERLTDLSTTVASGIFEFNVGSVTNLDRDGLNQLGRLFPDRDWVVFRWDAFHSFYLEPLLNPQGFRDVATPRSSTLAHEFAAGFKGQYAFGNRLIPQSQMVAGGLYSVRGYPESISAGDTVLIGTLEYRFHLPRAFRLQEEPGQLFGHQFRWAPQQVYGRADWDLILRTFVDAGRTINSDRLAFEEDETLIGVGVGAEFQFRRNLNLRVDWGFALKEIEDQVNSGSNRVHFAATILF